MAAVGLRCFDDVYLAAGVTSYMLARSSVRHLLRSYAPHVQICWSTKLSKYTYNETTSAGSSNAALLDKRGQRILRHVGSEVAVVGDTSSDASVAHRRLTKIWHTHSTSTSTSTSFFLLLLDISLKTFTSTTVSQNFRYRAPPSKCLLLHLQLILLARSRE